MKANKGVSNEKIKIIPLGGLEHIGMNITCIEYEDSIIVIDCGLSFPDEDMLGVDLVIPDVTYLKDNIEISKSAITKLENELWRTSRELYWERSIRRESKKPKECDYFYGQDDICLVNELLKNGIIRGIKF